MFQLLLTITITSQSERERELGTRPIPDDLDTSRLRCLRYETRPFTAANDYWSMNHALASCGLNLSVIQYTRTMRCNEEKTCPRPNCA